MEGLGRLPSGTRWRINIVAFTPSHVARVLAVEVWTTMKETAENYLGKVVRHVFVIVPAYSNYALRQSTEDAGTNSGTKVLRVANEPTAAAAAFCFDEEAEKNILVCDLIASLAYSGLWR